MLALALAVLSSGCQKQVEVPPMEVKTVEAYGQTLDENATPQQVAYVLLHSIRDDFEAAQRHDRQAQRAAFETTFSLAAYKEMIRRFEKSFGQKAAEGQAWDRKLYDIIYHWTPLVSHYVGSIEEDFDKATAKMQATTGADGQAARVFVPLMHNPTASSPAEQGRVILEIDMVKEQATSGTGSYWRVARLDYRHGVKPAATMTATAPS